MEMTRRVMVVLGGTLLAIMLVIGWRSTLSASAQTTAQAPGRDAKDYVEEKRRELMAMADAFPYPADVFLSVEQLKEGKPAITGVNMSSMVRVPGHEYFRMWREDEIWIVEPSKIVAIRMTSKKK
jgi:hypothetical protein